MGGMVQTTTVTPSRQDSTLSWSRWVIIVIATLCLSWNKSHAVFSSEMLRPANSYSLSRGSVDFYPVVSFGSQMQYLYSISFVSQTMLRNQIYIMNWAPRIHMAIDVLLLPFFTEFQDTGIEYTKFPVNGRVGVIFDYVKTDNLRLSAGPWLGGEAVSQYKQVYWGLEHSMALDLSSGLILGMKLQAAEVEFDTGLSRAVARAEAGLSYISEPINIAVSYLLEEDFYRPYSREYHSLKTGLAYMINSRFMINAGFNYQFMTAVWTASLGMDITEVNLFNQSIFLGTGFSYNPIGGISFHMSARWNGRDL